MLDALLQAAYARDSAVLLRCAKVHLDKLRIWLQLSHPLQLLDFRGHEGGSHLIDAQFRQVGGWL